jgi:hypothetical protein
LFRLFRWSTPRALAIGTGGKYGRLDSLSAAPEKSAGAYGARQATKPKKAHQCVVKDRAHRGDNRLRHPLCGGAVDHHR